MTPDDVGQVDWQPLKEALAKLLADDGPGFIEADVVLTHWSGVTVQIEASPKDQP